MKRILVVEDEPSILDNIAYALRTEGFDPVCCGTGEEALGILKAEPVSLIVLDIGLPDVSGFELLGEMRRRSTVPIIIVTARSHEVDRVVGLEIGADDYVVKPFSPRELTARIRAILRRAASGEAPPAESETTGGIPFSLNGDRCEIKYHGKALDLSRYGYRLLKALITSPGRVFSREQLMTRISESPEMSLERSIDTHIKTIRQKLRRVQPDEDPIVTHRGLGYSLRENR